MTNNESKTYQITIDPTPRSSKPPKDDSTIGKISNSLKTVTGVTIKQFATYVSSPYGYTWTSIFSGTINNENWKEQSVFALDFDKGLLTVDQVFERLALLGIYPQVWYSTFSDSPALPKFRVVLFLDQPVINLDQRKYITLGLLSLFPEADQQCKNAARFFFGGKQSYIKSEEPIILEKLVDALGPILITGDGGRTRKINPALFRGSRDIEETGKKWAFLYNNNTSSQIKPKPTSIEGGKLEIIDWDIAIQNVRILKEFVEGRWLFHNELFGLATNLIYINGGTKLMKKIMEKYNEKGITQYTPNNFNILTYLKITQYPPKPVHEFSPCPEDKDIYDIISATKDIRGKIEQTEPINRMELSEAEVILRNSFEEIIQNGEIGKIYLMCLPTAIGKTESILSLSNTTIAAPTNLLKNEIGSRMNVEFTATPNQVIFDNQSLNRKLIYYYSIGLPKKATAVVYDVINPKNSNLYSSEDILKAEKYLSDLKSSLNSSSTILTTHSRAIHTQFKNDTLIFDEDPLKYIIDIKQIYISDLNKMNVQSYNIFGSELDSVINYLTIAPPIVFNSTPTFSIDLDNLIDQVSNLNLESNIFEFFSSSYFVKDNYNKDIINYVIKRELPKDKKIIIMSATLPIYIYEQLYGDRLEIIDIRDVKQKGKVIQYTKRSCSRQGLKRYGNQIIETVGNKPVITFKTYSDKFQNPTKGIHFGNCSGYDTLKGQDIAVVGTPHKNNIEYTLTAKVIGIDFKTTDTTISYQKIEYNGFRFMFKCYDNEQLREIQLGLIESDLIQAIGRARTLRTDANVQVYSNYPLRISDEFIF